LNRDALSAWKKLTKDLESMGVLSEVDGYALERACQCYAEIKALEAKIKNKGRTFETTNQNGDLMVRARPEVGMLSDADRRFKGYLIEFGLTPAARSRLVVSQGSTKGKSGAEQYFD